MKITVFTSNQPRHTALVERLSAVADDIWVVRECTTIFAGEIDDLFSKSDTMGEYFTRVKQSEQRVFGSPRFGPDGVQELPLRMGDLSRVPLDHLKPALASDVYVVFGASYIKGDLADFLVDRGCFNIHMGTSPYYRGSSTNFWSMYDRRPEYTGATIHLLTRGLDSGPILYHAFPPTAPIEPFDLGMLAVHAAHESLAERIADCSLWDYEPMEQDRDLELRYSRNADFDDSVVKEYLGRLMTPEMIHERLAGRELDRFLRPYVATRR